MLMISNRLMLTLLKYKKEYLQIITIYSIDDYIKRNACRGFVDSLIIEVITSKVNVIVISFNINIQFEVFRKMPNKI